MTRSFPQTCLAYVIVLTADSRGHLMTVLSPLRLSVHNMPIEPWQLCAPTHHGASMLPPPHPLTALYSEILMIYKQKGGTQIILAVEQASGCSQRPQTQPLGISGKGHYTI
jgi:hypothetical protein